MKNRIRIFSFLLLVVHTLINAQTTLDKYNWSETPEKITKSDTTNYGSGVVCKFMDERYEYFYDESENILAYNVFHKKIHVISNEKINAFNKIYISLTDVIEIIEVKARSINPDGSVVYFEKNNLKEIKPDEGSEGYKIFAIEGIQKGADVEFFYIRKMYADFMGRTYIQQNYPIQNAVFELICPVDLLFDFKVYNDTSVIKRITEDRKNIYNVSFSSIEELEVPKYAYFNPLRVRIDYKLDRDRRIENVSRYTWDKAANLIYNLNYSLSKNEGKALRKLIKKELNNLPEDTYEKVLYVENYIKRNIVVKEYGSSDYGNLDFIINHKISNKQGIVKLYANILQNIGVEHQLLLTADRSNVKFDADFESFNFLEKYFIYINDLNKYLSPTENEYRLGIMSPMHTGVNGLFVKTYGTGEYVTTKGVIKFIPPLNYEQNYSNMLIELDIDGDNDKSIVKMEMSLNGLSGGYFSNIYDLIPENKKEEVLKSFIDNPAGGSDIKIVKLRDTSKLHVNDTIGGNPFIIYAEYESSSLLEKAGNKYILNIGETIGEQVEMYQKDKRVVDVENDYNRWYYREILVNIPEGYEIKNPEAVKMNIVHFRNSKKAYGFESDYQLNGSVYKVVINEYYKELYADKSMMGEFKKVVNAAADFNKVALILEKK